MEKTIKPMSGFLALILSVIVLFAAIYCITRGIPADGASPGALFWIGLALLLLAVFLFRGITAINPNHSRVCVFFGD